jgi:hypothetical protein
MRDKPREVMTLAGMKCLQSMNTPTDLLTVAVKAYYDATDDEAANLPIEKAFELYESVQERMKRDMDKLTLFLKNVSGRSQSSPTAG